MSQDSILGTESVKDALKTKVNGDMTELFAIATEVANARDGEPTLLAKINSIDAYTAELVAARDGESSLLNKINAIETALTAATSGSGVYISSNDAATGYVNGKLVAGEGVDFTENNDGSNETLTISCEDASSSNKGVSSFSSAHFSVSSGAVSLAESYFKKFGVL